MTPSHSQRIGKNGTYQTLTLRRRRGRAITSESGIGEPGPGAWASAGLAASPLRPEAANPAEAVLVLLVLINVRFLSPPFSNCPGLLVSRILAQRATT